MYKINEMKLDGARFISSYNTQNETFCIEIKRESSSTDITISYDEVIAISEMLGELARLKLYKH